MSSVLQSCKDKVHRLVNRVDVTFCQILYKNTLLLVLPKPEVFSGKVKKIKDFFVVDFDHGDLDSNVQLTGFGIVDLRIFSGDDFFEDSRH